MTAAIKKVPASSIPAVTKSKKTPVATPTGKAVQARKITPVAQVEIAALCKNTAQPGTVAARNKVARPKTLAQDMDVVTTRTAALPTQRAPRKKIALVKNATQVQKVARGKIVAPSIALTEVDAAAQGAVVALAAVIPEVAALAVPGVAEAAAAPALDVPANSLQTNVQPGAQESVETIVLPARMELASLDEAHQLLQNKYPPVHAKYILDGALINVIDMAGVQLLISFIRSMTAKGSTVEWDNYSVQMYQLASELGVTSQLGD